MTERQAAYDATPVAILLPDEFEQRLDALADDKDTPRWRGVGAVALDAIKQMGKQKKMIVYQRCADRFGLGVSTIRLWVRYSTELGEFFDEMPFTPEWTLVRLAHKEAKARESSVESVLLERYNDADKFGGQLCPFRVWSSQLRNGKDDGRDPVIAKLERLSQSAATALKGIANNPKYMKNGFAIQALAIEIEVKCQKLLETAEKVK